MQSYILLSGPRSYIPQRENISKGLHLIIVVLGLDDPASCQLKAGRETDASSRHHISHL
jgi:hypothetical protein